MVAARQSAYWWYRARRTMAVALLRRFGLQPNCSWIDIGCGPGGNLHMLDSFNPSRVVGLDISPIALSLAASSAPHATLVQADMNETLPFESGSFDVATIFNVLYHQWIRSESAVLSEAHRILKPGGLLLITEPAFDPMKREMDYVAMTRRRYRNTEFDAWLAETGFEDVFSSYFTSFGVPILLALNYFSSRGRNGVASHEPGVDMRDLPKAINEPLYASALLESSLIVRGAKMPFGTTLVRVARRRSTLPL